MLSSTFKSTRPRRKGFPWMSSTARHLFRSPHLTCHLERSPPPAHCLEGIRPFLRRPAVCSIRGVVGSTPRRRLGDSARELGLEGAWRPNGYPRNVEGGQEHAGRRGRADPRQSSPESDWTVFTDEKERDLLGDGQWGKVTAEASPQAGPHVLCTLKPDAPVKPRKSGVSKRWPETEP